MVAPSNLPESADAESPLSEPDDPQRAHPINEPVSAPSDDTARVQTLGSLLGDLWRVIVRSLSHFFGLDR